MSTANKISLVSNRVERAKSLLLSQFHDKPNINALVDALVSELQELENVLNNLQTVHTLEGAYGKWIDLIGEELDVSRGNYNDNDYKTAIKIAMAKQTASASVDDILRIVSLITGDSSAQLNNNSHYLLELWSYLFCVSDSYDGLDNLGKLFPLNTRIRIVKHDVKPFGFGVSGRGFGVGATLNSLVYAKAGITQDPRFINAPTQEIPPALETPPYFLTSPYIYGTGVAGSTLTLVNGTYDGDDPITLVNQWLLDGADITGETGSTYVVDNADAGKLISVRSSITNAYGSAYTYTNSIVIDVDIPVTNPLESDLGLYDYIGSTEIAYDGNPHTVTSTIVIGSDGTIVYKTDGVSTGTDAWLKTTGAGLGADYKLIYTVLSGSELVGLNQNTPFTLSANATLSLSTSSKSNSIKTGRYRFNIYKTSDNTISYTRDINITAQLETVI